MLSALEVRTSFFGQAYRRTDSELGQLPQNIALRLKESGVKVLGTDPEKIDMAEDRHKFSSVLDNIGVDQPEWTEVTSVEAAKAFAQRVGQVIAAFNSTNLALKLESQISRAHSPFLRSLRCRHECRL